MYIYYDDKYIITINIYMIHESVYHIRGNV